jgi:hypothetical protein
MPTTAHSSIDWPTPDRSTWEAIPVTYGFLFEKPLSTGLAVIPELMPLTLVQVLFPHGRTFMESVLQPSQQSGHIDDE